MCIEAKSLFANGSGKEQNPPGSQHAGKFSRGTEIPFRIHRIAVPPETDMFQDVQTTQASHGTVLNRQSEKRTLSELQVLKGRRQGPKVQIRHAAER
jgi:hypothetical protein